jgi:molybdopterin-guanine dinucleotide biosynthesis protein A
VREGEAALGGVLVGGASSRMGRPKGLLRGPDGRPLAERALAVLREAGLDAALVGVRAEYAALGPAVPDAAPDAGPLAGLVALLERADGRRVVLLACDMPYVTAADVRALLAIEGRVVAPRRDGRWEPLCAAYESSVLPEARARLDAGRRSVSGLIEALGAVEAPIDPAHLVDWDTPADVSDS